MADFKLVYVVAQAHTGSTLVDCILGTHPDICSSGELRYLNWQIFRTRNTDGTAEEQSICTCGEQFRNCEFWKNVILSIDIKTGSDFINDVDSFDLSYFHQFGYKDRSGLKRSIFDKLKAVVFRLWIEQGWSYKKILWIEPLVQKWLKNNWLLYEEMAQKSKSKIVVDSTKDLRIALLLQQYKPDQVHVMFLNRKIEGVIAAKKRWSKKRNETFDLAESIKQHKVFQKRIAKYKRNITSLKFIDVNYEDYVQSPSAFLKSISERLNIDSPLINYQSNEEFYINPNELHLVAGNPMRFKGKQLVKADERWKQDLTEKEIETLKSLKIK